ncbi:DUF937 domain-containing protein [Candidatus Saccharibacteria bacterium]|nr:MAG: DUF937 domain-containing protein [Candidatus Saccharibacteria bacterium]
MDLQARITDLIKGNISDSISRSTGVSQPDVERVITAGLPMIIGQMGNNASSPEGATALDAAIGKDHAGGSLLDSLGSLFEMPTTQQDGSKILDHVLGANSTVVTNRLSKQTGVDPAAVMKILAFAAPLIMAFLGREKQSQNLDAGGIADILKGQRTPNGSLLTELASTVLTASGSKKSGGLLGSLLNGLFGRR